MFNLKKNYKIHSEFISIPEKCDKLMEILSYLTAKSNLNSKFETVVLERERILICRIMHRTIRDMNVVINCFLPIKRATRFPFHSRKQMRITLYTYIYNILYWHANAESNNKGFFSVYFARLTRTKR